MRYGALTAFLLMCLWGTPLSAQRSTDNDYCYDPAVIKSWTESPFDLGSSFVEKQVYRTGDGVALGIVLTFTPKELTEPDRVRRILSVIKVALSYPDLIVNHQDRDPRATLLLLYYLEHQVRDEPLRRAIVEMEQYVTAQAKGPWTSRMDPRDSRDCDNRREVRSWVESNEGAAEGSAATKAQVLREGDGVALGAVGSFAPQELVEPPRTERTIRLIRLAFSQPNRIASKRYRNPHVTVLLLYYLERQVEDKTLHQEILDLERYVASQTRQFQYQE